MSKKIEPFEPMPLSVIHEEHKKSLGLQFADRMISEEFAVKALGDRIGYGRLMSAAQSCWREVLAGARLQGSEFSVGPCVAMTVKCGCQYTRRSSSGCDWCCGAGWVTRKVREVQIEKGTK